jgi:hypothetical protein
LVLVAVHWGDNYRGEPSLQKRLIGQAIIDAGADAVLGSSAHMLQGVEVHKGRPIIHDAGNLLFDFSDGKTRKSGLFSLSADDNGIVGLEFYPVLSEPGFSVPAKGVLAREIIREMITKSKRLGTVMQASDRETAILALPKLPVRSALGRTIPPNPTIRPAPAPRSKPPLGCVIKSVPEEVAIDPIQIGPFQLVGLRVHPELITERQILWVESFWRLDKFLDKEYLFDIRAIPLVGSSMPPWRGVHQPCDWMWPTSRWKEGVIYRDYYGLRPPARNLLEDSTMTLEIAVLAASGEVEFPRKIAQNITILFKK